MLGQLALWGALLCAFSLPIALAATSPLLQWRDPIYIMAGLSGIIALALMLAQPLFATGRLLPNHLRIGRQVHRWLGLFLLIAVIAHVVGLWLTSPPDVVDALLLRSPTPFSIWGVLAMWALFLAAASVLFRKRLGLRLWRRGHTSLTCLAVLGTGVHILLIEGTMDPVSKVLLPLCALLLVLKAIWGLRIWHR